MSNIDNLRSVLFETLQELKAGTLDLDKAKAINETAQTIINTAKVEVDYARVTGAEIASNFLPAPAPEGTYRERPTSSRPAITGSTRTPPNTGPKGSI